MKKLKNPKVLITLAMISFGTIGIFVKNIPLSSGEIALYRALLAIVLLGSVLLITKQKINFKSIKKDLIFLLISGMAMGINWILLFEAYKYTSVSVATLSYYFAPILVTIISPILFKEKLTIKQIICFVASTIGIVLLTGISDFNSNPSNIIGIILGLSAAVFYASVVLLNKYIKGVSGMNRTFLQFVASIIVLIPYVCFSGSSILNINQTGLICLLVVGLFHTGLCYFMYFTSLKELKGQEAAILSYTDPLVAVVISIVFLKEQITFIQVIGGILILGFSILNEISFSKKND